MSFTPKNWIDTPSTATPLSAVAIEDLETRLTDYTDFKGPISVMEPPYNATGDGATNDATEVQAAFDAAAGGVVLLPAGFNFRVEDDITVSADTMVLGYGATLTIVDNGVAANRSLFIDAVSNVSVLGLTITSTASARTGVYGNIRAEGADHVTIKDCTTGVSPSTGIFLHTTSDFIIENNRVEDAWADGIHIQRHCVRGVVRGNQVRNVDDDGIGVISIDDEDNCESIVVEGNVIDTNAVAGAGISVVGGRNIVVASNAIRNIFAGGISVVGGAGFHFPVGIDVVGNGIYDVNTGGGSATGITITNARRVNIANNIIDDVGATGTGIKLSDVVKDVNVTGNQVSRTTDRGIELIQTTSTDADLIQELFTDVGEAGVATATTSAVTIAHNTIRQCANEGVYTIAATGGDMQQIKIIGNGCSENTIAGQNDFFIGNLAYSVIVGNDSRSVSATGTHFMFNTSEFLAITGNNAHGSADGFLFIDCDTSVATNNVADVTTGSAFWEDGSSTGNTLANNISA